MCLKISEYIFEVVGILLLFLLAFRTFCPNIFKNSKYSPLMAVLGALFIFYVLSGIVLLFFIPTIKYKFIILLFTISPFLIGKLVSYEKLKFYSIIQQLCVILSVVFVMLI